MQKWKLSQNMYALRVHIFARLPPDLHAQSAFINKISASELTRKFIKSALIVGWVFRIGFFILLRACLPRFVFLLSRSFPERRMDAL